MEEEKYQKELFEFKKPKKSFPKLSNFLPKADFERNILITLSIEKVIFISIGIIMATVVVYALGVEVGKSRAANRIVSQVSVKKEARPQQPLQVKALPTYTIVAGTYARKDNAMATMTRLRQGGFDACIGQSQPFFQVWVVVKTGADPTKELARLKKLYKDAYLKQR